jgi:hypothetical protein
LTHGDEFDRHHVRALVQHLEVGMLAVGARLAPQHGRGAIGQRLASQVHPLAVALHLQLLQIGRKAAQGAVVRRDAAAGETEEVAVPDIQQAQAHRQVLGQRRTAEMLVHGMGARQKVRKPAAPMAMASGRPMADQTE